MKKVEPINVRDAGKLAASKLTPAQRTEKARKAAQARWKSQRSKS